MSTQDVVQNLSMNTGCIPLRFNESQHLPWDNPHNIVSQEVEALVGEIRDIILALLFLIGGPANVINMAVFYRQGLHDRVNLCLFMLSVSDELYLATSLLLHSENLYLRLSNQAIKTPVTKFMANNNLIFLHSSGFISYCQSTIIACERCYCVLRPLKYQTLMRTRTMAIIIFSLYVSMFSIYFIVCYRYWIQCAFDPVTNEIIMMMTGGGIYVNHKNLIDTLEGIFLGAILPVILIVTVITATIITTVKLRQIVTWRTEASSSLSAREISLTKMLIGNSVFFLVCICPLCVVRIAYLSPGITAGGTYHNFYLSSLWVLETSSFFNCALNFFIYYAMGTRYRETFWTLFRKNSKQ